MLRDIAHRIRDAARFYANALQRDSRNANGKTRITSTQRAIVKAHVGARIRARSSRRTVERIIMVRICICIELRSDTGEYAYSGWRQRGVSENSVSQE